MCSNIYSKFLICSTNQSQSSIYFYLFNFIICWNTPNHDLLQSFFLVLSLYLLKLFLKYNLVYIYLFNFFPYLCRFFSRFYYQFNFNLLYVQISIQNFLSVQQTSHNLQFISICSILLSVKIHQTRICCNLDRKSVV